MDKKQKRRVIVLSVLAALVILVIVALFIYGSRKAKIKQFSVKNDDKLAFNPFVENEERSDNSLLEYGKVLTKYGDKYSMYSGKDIVLNAADFYGISFKIDNGETLYLYRGSDGSYEKVSYRGKYYDYNQVLAGEFSFATESVVEKIKRIVNNISFDEDYGFTYYVDIDDNRDEQGYTRAATAEERYTQKSGSIAKDPNAIYFGKPEAGDSSSNAIEELTFIYKPEIPETALYSMNVEYFLPENRSNNTLVRLSVDNKYPFKEAAGIELKRLYGVFDIKSIDIAGNEIRNQQQELFRWQTVTLSNPEGLYRNPYRFLINASSLASAEKPRTISLTFGREPVVVKSITLTAPLASPTYEEYKSLNSFSEDKIVKDGLTQVEFEIPETKNTISIRSEWDGDYASYPASYEVTRYNYFGGDRWTNGGDGASWRFSVPKDGWYQIGFRYKNTLTDIAVYGEIKIDDVIPFKDMEEYCFPYTDGWAGCSLMDDNQQPYYFYLTAGEHMITITSKVGPLRAAIQSLQESMDAISKLISMVVNITGATRGSNGGYSVDKNRDWDLDKYIMGIEEEVKNYRDTFDTIFNEIKAANGGVLPYYGSAVSVAKALFSRLSRGTEGLEDIPSSLNEISNALTSLSTSLQNITEQPIAIDYMVVHGGEFNYSKCRSNAFQSFYVGAIKFGDSFTKDYSLVGSRENTGTEKAKEIQVYVARGREYVEMLRALIAEDFTPKTGIKVNVNMVSTGVEGLVMLRYVTGTAPDVAISVGAGAPVEYAARGALVAYNDLDGDGVSENQEEFDQFFEENFLPGAKTLSRYRGNYYSVPETQTWAALFYRTDILQELGIDKIPSTWDEVYEILPRLQEKSMDFCYNYGTGNLYPFLYQNGATVYDPDGLVSALDSTEAYDAFYEYANLYNKYNIPYAANFYMKFKLGDMPIGIADMGMYCQLKYSAPEINGKWTMAPVPGHLKEDGTVDRSMGGSLTTCIMIKNKGERLKSQEAWEFVKWWMSESTQVAYAQEVEATFGVASRWNTANKLAINSMAYSDEELEVINEQWSYFTETPIVLGGYYTARYLTTALNQAVLQGDNIRIALEDAVREINKEMRRKQKEFFPEAFLEDGTLDPEFSIIWSMKGEG